jgi:hypothetical protein
MKYLSLIAAISLAMVSTSIAQVKKTYQDKDHSQTTVVVKEEGSEDYDILDEHFDIETYSVGQVIMIKTEPDTAPAVAGATSTIADSGSQVISEMVVTRRYDFASKPGETSVTTMSEVESLPSSEVQMEMPKQESPAMTMTFTAVQQFEEKESADKEASEVSGSAKSKSSGAGIAKASTGKKKTKFYKRSKGLSLKINIFSGKNRSYKGKRGKRMRCFKF